MIVASKRRFALALVVTFMLGAAVRGCDDADRHNNANTTQTQNVSR